MKPRAYTAEECREMLLEHVRGVVAYWAEVGEREMRSRFDVCEGLAFSLLVLLDGGDATFPAFDLIPSPHSSDEDYHKKNGSNWWPKVVINDCQLHEQFCEMNRKARES